MGSTSDLCYLYVGANEENKQLKEVLEKARAEITELREQIDLLKGDVDGGDTNTIPRVANGR